MNRRPMKGYVRLRTGIVEHWQAMNPRQYAVFHLLLAMQLQDLPENGKVGTIAQVVSRVNRFRKDTIYKAVPELEKLGYIRIDEDDGIIWINNPNEIIPKKPGRRDQSLSLVQTDLVREPDKFVRSSDNVVRSSDKLVRDTDKFVRSSDKNAAINRSIDLNRSQHKVTSVCNTDNDPQSGDGLLGLFWDQENERIWGDPETLRSMKSLWMAQGYTSKQFQKAVSILNTKIATKQEPVPFDVGVRLQKWLTSWMANRDVGTDD